MTSSSTSGDRIVKRALESLGKGFDLTSDFRLKFCKGENRLVNLNETDTRELSVPGFGSFKNVSIDIQCDKGDRIRYQSDILEFNQMSEVFNQRCSVPGKVPSGLFNSMFGFESGSWAKDAANTKYLGLDGYFIALFNLHLHRYPLILDDHVINSVPSSWDPSALARFIEKYGTHIIVGVSVGGQDVVLVKQDKSSNMEPSELKNHLDNLGDQLFTGACTFSPHHLKSKQLLLKHKVPQAFDVFVQQPNLLSNFPLITIKDGISVKCSKRGGDSCMTSHCEWLLTVPSMPDAIHFNFIPITSLLRGVPGRGFLSHAINLYLRYKPPIGDLQYFLDFQRHRIWAPIHNDLHLGLVVTRRRNNKAFQPESTLQFSLGGPKLYVNTCQVTVGSPPVTGMRLYLEGIKCNRLGIHLQHLINPPTIINENISPVVLWRGSEEAADSHLYLEHIQWKKFSQICSSPVKYDPKWLIDHQGTNQVSFVVTGAQLYILNNVLHLRLSFSTVSNCYVVQSTWMEAAQHNSFKSGFFSSFATSVSGNITNKVTTDNEKEKQTNINVDSGVYPTGPPVPVPSQQKLLKFVDTSELCKGPSDTPGHWLATGAKLHLENGKICLRVKFSLLMTTCT